MALSDHSENENTQLQLQLKDLTKAMSKFGSTASGLLFVSLLVRYFFEPASLQRYFDLSLLKYKQILSFFHEGRRLSWERPS